MRPITLAIWQNLGTGVPGNSLSITANVTRLGKISQEIDEQLTLVSAGELTVEGADPTGAVWEFVQTQLALAAAEGSGLLPPYLQLLVAGQQKYLGTVDPSRIVQHQAADEGSIEFGSQDWSIQLANTYLGAQVANAWQPKHVYPTGGQEVIFNGNCYQCQIPGTSGSIGPVWNPGSATITDGSVTWTYLAPGWTRPAPAMAVATYGGGLLPGSLNYLVVTKASASGDTAIWLQGVDGIFPQDVLEVVYSQSGSGGTFTVQSTDPELLRVNVAETVSGLTNGNGVYFDSATNQELVMADAVQTLQMAASPFAIDTSRFVKTPLPIPVFSWLPVIQIAVAPWASGADYAQSAQVSKGGNTYLCVVPGVSGTGGPSGVSATTPVVDGSVEWIYQPPVKTNLVAISDLEPTLTGIRVISGFSCAYYGNPDLGWTAERPVLPTASPCTALPTQPQYADWTNQLAAAPATLMPYTNRTGNPATGSAGDAWNGPLRNRCYSAYSWGSLVDNGPTSWYQGPGQIPYWDASEPWTWYDPFVPETANLSWFQTNQVAPTQIFYDYLAMQKVVITTTPGGAGTQQIMVNPWTGSGWGPAIAKTWPSGHLIHSISSFPGGPAGAYVAMTSNGTLELGLLGAAALLGSCGTTIPLLKAQLVPTLYGPCLVGSCAYGQVTFQNGVLACPNVTVDWYDGTGLDGQVTAWWPNTFVAVNSTTAVVLGRKDTTKNGTTTTESLIYQLSMPPCTQNPQASILTSETIGAGAPVFAGAILDPSKPGRVVGHWGGQLWQYDTEMPWVIPRFTPDGMSSLECIEHICQIFNALAVPQPSGEMAIVSRAVTDTPIPLTVQVVKVDTSLSWQHFYSTVRATTQDGSLYYDAPAGGGQKGGGILEINNQPMLWFYSQAGAMAEGYAAWFGQPRAMQAHTWTYPDPDTAPPWEGLPPFALITVNGTGPWRVLALEQDDIEGTAEAVLVEA